MKQQGGILNRPKEDKMTASRAALSALTKTPFSKTPVLRSFLARVASAQNPQTQNPQKRVWYNLQCQVIHTPTPNTNRRALSCMSSEICLLSIVDQVTNEIF
jgi:hypothetical protein